METSGGVAGGVAPREAGRSALTAAPPEPLGGERDGGRCCGGRGEAEAACSEWICRRFAACSSTVINPSESRPSSSPSRELARLLSCAWPPPAWLRAGGELRDEAAAEVGRDGGEARKAVGREADGSVHRSFACEDRTPAPIGLALQENWCFAMRSAANVRPHTAHGTRPSAPIGAISIGPLGFEFKGDLGGILAPPPPPPPLMLPSQLRRCAFKLPCGTSMPQAGQGTMSFACFSRH